MQAMTLEQLTKVYNGLALSLGWKPIKGVWKGTKDKIIARVKDAEAVAAGKQAEAEAERDAAPEPNDVAGTLDAINEAVGPIPQEAPPAEPAEPRVTIKDAAIDALKVTDAEGKGLPYDEVLEFVLAAFPDAKTTVKCLQWYAAQAKAAGDVFPERPRRRKNADRQ